MNSSSTAFSLLAAWLGTFLGILLGICLAGCAPAGPDVIVISVDSLRGDQLGSVVGGRDLTPRVHQLAEESLLFENAVSPAPWTTPAMISVMTGLPPAAHGVYDHDRALASEVPTLAERFLDAGYRTAAFVPAVTLRKEFGFGRGFEVFDYEEFGHTRLSSPRLIGKVLAQRERWPDEPSFIWVHLWDPHYNYNPPTPFDTEFRRGVQPPSEEVQCLKWFENPVSAPQAEYLRSLQEGEVLFTDHYIGELVDALREQGGLEDTILVVLADHGEAFLEHGWLGHTNRVDQTLVHVPMLIRWPGGLSPGRVSEPVSIASLGKRLLDLAGVEAGGFPELEPLPIAETRRRGCFTSLASSHWKYVIEHNSCQESLFDLGVDPGELEDLSRSKLEQLISLRTRLRERLAHYEGAGISRAMLPAEITDSAQENLRSLAYLGGGGGAQEDEAVDDPCAKVNFGLGVDSFGDREDGVACPDRGALDCLDRISQ